MPYGLEGVKEYAQLKIRKKADDGSEPVIEKDLGKFMEIQVFPWEKHKEIPKNQYTKWFDYDKMENALCLRFRRTGDYITLKDGGRKTLKKFMIESKIPRQDRERIPVLADGNHIVWIVGYRISEYYKITEHTKTVKMCIRDSYCKSRAGAESGAVERQADCHGIDVYKRQVRRHL